MNLAEKHTLLIKQKAEKFGFRGCGISKADFLESEAKPLENYLNKNMNGKMQYLENYFDKRLDPRLLVEGSKSVISFSYNYYPRKILNTDDNYKLSKYAYGMDYHFIIKDILSDFVAELQEEIGEFDFRIFTDSAPVLEKAWARNSGLGWVGKNALLISKGLGSFHFLGEIICDLDLIPDPPATDHCGTCRKCIDACPTQAIEQPYVINGSKCISYATIELKGDLPESFQGKMEDWMFGCDICQDVCPWNRFAKPHNQPLFDPNESLQKFNKKEWKELTQEVFSEIFRKSAVKRTKFSGLMRNIEFVDKK
ncbi:tRNA epoxyqueuosine(34) reductase QueG [Elizabethkingia sp. JS20170427COW]|uniref:tRNA epoxyqueuosine(34) reductase QueG n=1 Tax=Elizabethkingia sp. JS20170427COW TaxID=2583851 RepID=UPI0011109860|nr:tRNA epoxyqueuosine(34) reductase QueG [Elizabethkingia sp. JS20170427COW]QCX52651.1 tRNA epoxyqueuosine(34) reductase QueG [Elizabethkingia sp. JS20170427COW]